MQNDQPAYPLESVDNALSLLLLLRERHELRVADAAAYLGVARSTAHRLLSALRHRGFVTQDSRRIYRPGRVFFDVGLSVVQAVDVRRVARGHLAALNEELGETVHLMTLEGNGVRFLDGIEGRQVLRVGTRTGMLLPAHATSGGKALLAELSVEELLALYPRGVPAVANSRIATFGDLRRELVATRRRGYGSNVEESDRGISAVGVCVRDRTGRAVAAVATAIPSARFQPAQAAEYAGILRRTADLVSGDL